MDRYRFWAASLISSGPHSPDIRKCGINFSNEGLYPTFTSKFPFGYNVKFSVHRQHLLPHPHSKHFFFFFEYLLLFSPSHILSFLSKATKPGYRCSCMLIVLHRCANGPGLNHICIPREFHNQGWHRKVWLNVKSKWTSLRPSRFFDAKYVIAQFKS